MEHIDTILASTLDTGDLVELWDDDESEYVIEEAYSVEDDDDYMIVTTDRFPGGMAVPSGSRVRIFGY